MKAKSTDNTQKPTGAVDTLTQVRSTSSNAIDIPQITLPKGGGAIKGIDDTFKINPANGTASFSIPLPFSANRNGFSPQVALAYNSGAGNGLMGIGWDLNLPSIQRNTNKKLPRYRDTNQVDQVGDEDSFLLSGADELVPYLDYTAYQWTVRQRTEGDVVIRQYRPRQEGDFARIERIYQPATGYYWKVTTSGNITTFFGMSEACRTFDLSVLNDFLPYFQSPQAEFQNWCGETARLFLQQLEGVACAQNSIPFRPEQPLRTELA